MLENLTKKDLKPLVVPYITGQMRDDWLDIIYQMANAKADAIEVGLPFSDPMIDGPTIQESSKKAIDNGATTDSILDGLASLDIDCPIYIMTYYNLIVRVGIDRFVERIVSSKVKGLIVPDLPLEEIDELNTATRSAGVSQVLLVAPSTPDLRMASIAKRSAGFLYTMGLMGVTGERSSLPQSALETARRAKKVAPGDLPVLVGIGVSLPEQAKEITKYCDGVVVGSAIVRRILNGSKIDEIGEFIQSFKS